MKKIVWVGLSAALFLVIGCASIIHGGTQDVTVSSEPGAARVSVYDRYNHEIWTGTAPCTIPMDRGDGFLKKAHYRIEVAKEGYEPNSVYISSSLDAGWYLVGNFFIGGLVGWLIVDPASGAMWRLKPKEIHTHLDQRSAGLEGEGVKVVLRSSLSDSAFQQLEPERIR